MRVIIGCCLALVSASWFSACSRGDAAPASARDPRLPQPAVEPLGRVLLAESESLYVGRPSGLVVDPADGSLYVTDSFWGRVLRFSPDGALLRTYGARGEGPGELKDPGAVAVAGGTVLVADVGTERLTRFDRDAGTFQGSIPYRGRLTSIEPGPGRYWMGTLNVAGKTSLSTWAPGDPGVRPLGTVPVEFTQSQPLASIYTGVEVAAWGDTVLAGYTGINRLMLFRTDGTEIRSLSVPVRARRGEMPKLVERFGKLDFPEMFAANSALFRMARLPGGSIALVHYDQTIDGSLIQATVYLTLMSPDFSRACVDREIPVSKDAQPYTAFRGDTLFVLQQKVAGERASTYVERHRINEKACFSA